MATEGKLSLPPHNMPFRDIRYVRLVIFKKQKSQKERLAFPLTRLKEFGQQSLLAGRTLSPRHDGNLSGADRDEPSNCPVAAPPPPATHRVPLFLGGPSKKYLPNICSFSTLCELSSLLSEVPGPCLPLLGPERHASLRCRTCPGPAFLRNSRVCVWGKCSHFLLLICLTLI